MHQATIPKRRPDYDVGLGHPPDLHLNQPQNERAHRKGAEAQRGRIGQLAVLWVLIQARLELTTERREPALGGQRTGKMTDGGVVDMRALGDLGLGCFAGGAAAVAGVGHRVLQLMAVGGFVWGRHDGQVQGVGWA